MGRTRAGFTMIEIIVIVAVIAILGGILTPLVMKELAKSKVSRASADMNAISIAFTQYYADTSYWPEQYTGAASMTDDFEDYQCLYIDTVSLPGWDGPYMQRGVPGTSGQQAALQTAGVWDGVIDPWGKPFRIVCLAPNDSLPGGGIAVVSGGSDGTVDTADTDAVQGNKTDDDLVTVVTRRVRG